jgi:hypothetical protein
MDTDLALVRYADRNQEDAWLRMLLPSSGTRTQRFGSILAVATGLPLDLFNPIFATEATADDLGNLRDAVAFVESMGGPPLVHLRAGVDEAVEALLVEHDMIPVPRDMPGMVLVPIGEPDEPPSSLEIRVADDERSFKETIRTAAIGFGMPVDPIVQAFSPAILQDPGFVALIGSVDGRPVATSMLVMTEDMAGVYTVAVVPEARRMGFGRLMTRRAIQEGVARGATRACLQASGMGEPIYVAMGFRTVTSYRLYVVPSQLS